MTPPDGDPCHAIRLAAEEDVPFLRSMLVEATNWSPNQQRRSVEETLSDPQVAHYLDGWPRAGDFGIVALDRFETRIGACWVRYMPIDDPGYGYVAVDVPELGIAVIPEARNRGVGRALLRRVAREAKRTNVKRLSLSVEQNNPAAQLYRSEGWRTIRSEAGSDTMVLNLT